MTHPSQPQPLILASNALYTLVHAFARVTDGELEQMDCERMCTVSPFGYAETEIDTVVEPPFHMHSMRICSSCFSSQLDWFQIALQVACASELPPV